MRLSLRLALPLTAACLLSLFACTGPPTGSADPPPRSIQVIDQSVVATVQMNLKTDPELAASGIQVSAENDLLILRGTVTSEEAKKKAEEIAKKTPRIEKIANHIEVEAGEKPVP